MVVETSERVIESRAGIVGISEDREDKEVDENPILKLPLGDCTNHLR